MFHDQAMAEQWIIRVQGKDYGPADLVTLREWKADGRILPTNPARVTNSDNWQAAADIPGLFQVEPPPVQLDTSQRLEVSDQKSKPPTRNILVETFRIYFRGFFQFLGLSLLNIIPILCSEFFDRFINAAPGVNPELRTAVAEMFRLCMFVVWVVLIPIYIAGIQILSAELATGHRIGFLSVLNGAVKYWPRVAGLCIFVYAIFGLLTLLGYGLFLWAASANTVLSAVIVLGSLVIQIWLFSRFFIKVLFWQQFAVLENLHATDALRESRKLARSGHDLPWYQRPLWRGALIVSICFAFVLAIALVAMWPRLIAIWPFYRDLFSQLSTAPDSEAAVQKIIATMPKEQPATLTELGLSVLQRILQPLLGIAFVVLYLDSKGEENR
jgi:GYF domain 2